MITSSVPVFPCGRPQLAFPPLTGFSASDVGKPVFVFDGLDHDTLPAHIRPQYHDCYQENYRCIRFRHYIDPVCGFNVETSRWNPYVSLCQLDLQNCIEMVAKERGMHGKQLKDRIIYYMGDGEKCEHEVRRFQDKVQRLLFAATIKEQESKRQLWWWWNGDVQRARTCRYSYTELVLRR
ncbi:uncharacterized protein [Maniola hyperantus]|uniref:uncharacterized protein isoform X2 n=1 Tax=Aphantopus hyperantus TaxID=2795564 RepID=UPI0037488CF9